MKFKIVFDSKINTLTNQTNQIFNFDIEDTSQPNNSIQVGQGRGLAD